MEEGVEVAQLRDRKYISRHTGSVGCLVGRHPRVCPAARTGLYNGPRLSWNVGDIC